MRPRPDGSIPQAAINQVHDHLYVVPVEAFGLLAAHRLDRDLFDVTRLLDYEYDDASRGTLPVMVDYGRGPTAAAESRTRVLRGRRAHGDGAQAGRHRVPRREDRRAGLLGRPHQGRRRRGQPDRAARRRRARRPRRPGAGRARGLGPADPRPRGLGRRLRRHRRDRRGARHGLRPHPPRPRRPGGRHRQLHHRRHRHRRQRARDARRLDRGRQRRRLRRASARAWPRARSCSSARCSPTRATARTPGCSPAWSGPSTTTRTSSA